MRVRDSRETRSAIVTHDVSIEHGGEETTRTAHGSMRDDGINGRRNISKRM